jgi:hypothetical protein
VAGTLAFDGQTKEQRRLLSWPGGDAETHQALFLGAKGDARRSIPDLGKFEVHVRAAARLVSDVRSRSRAAGDRALAGFCHSWYIVAVSQVLGRPDTFARGPLDAVARSNVVVDVVATERGLPQAMAREVAEARRPSSPQGLFERRPLINDPFAKALNSLVERTGGSLLSAEAGAALAPRFVRILDEFRSRYLLMYEPTRVPRGGAWHELTVRVKGHGLRTHARSGYFAGK